MIIPSIDLMDGKAVQLQRGRPEDKALERDDVFAVAERFARVGDLAVIDLDAALSRGENRELVRALCRRFPCRVGGGIRTVDDGRALLAAGAKRLIIGTVASPGFLENFRPDQVIVAVDEKAGEVTSHGWTQGQGVTAEERIQQLEAYCSGFLYTVVDKEGMLGGTSLDRIRSVVSSTKRTVTAAGGITTADEVRAIADLGAESQLGMAIYTGKLELEPLLCELAAFDKHDGGLLPTVVEDHEGQLLMLAYSTRETLERALREGKGIYWSRSRGEVWEKGATSGHTQELLRARLDCDRDAMRFTVRQTGPACHRRTETCWGDRRPTLGDVEAVLGSRLRQPTGSFASELMASERLIRRKLHEEVWEVSDAKDREHTIFEAADLLFFATALLTKRGISWREVLETLRGRRKP